jgi:hypothetical protein
MVILGVVALVLGVMLLVNGIRLRNRMRVVESRNPEPAWIRTELKKYRK